MSRRIALAALALTLLAGAPAQAQWATYCGAPGSSENVRLVQIYTTQTTISGVNSYQYNIQLQNARGSSRGIALDFLPPPNRAVRKQVEGRGATYGAWETRQVILGTEPMAGRTALSHQDIINGLRVLCTG